MTEPILIIVLLNLVAFFPSLRSGLVADDCHHWIDVKKGLLVRAREQMVKRNFRPSAIAYWLNKCLYGCGTFGTKAKYALMADHAFRLVLHTTLSVMIYLALGANTVSFCAALLYSVNPSNHHTSLWLNGRRYLINIMIVMAMIMLGPIGLVLYPATMIFQANAIFAPILLGGWYWLVIPAVMIVNRKRAVAFYKDRMKAIVNDEMRKWHWKRFIVVIKTYGFYVSNLVFPRRTLMSYPLLDAEGWGLTVEGNRKAYALDKWFWLGVLSLVVTAVGMTYLRGDILLWGIFAFLSLMAWCNWICATQLIADRYANMSSPFVMFFISSAAFMLPGQWPYVVIVSLMAWYWRGLIDVFPMYKNLEAYYEYHNFHYRNNIMFRRWRANWLMNVKDPMGAWEHIRIGLSYHPDDFSFLYLAGCCMHVMGNFEASEFYLDKASKNYYIGQEKVSVDKLNQLRAKNREMIPKVVSHSREMARREKQIKAGKLNAPVS